MKHLEIAGGQKNVLPPSGRIVVRESGEHRVRESHLGEHQPRRRMVLSCRAVQPIQPGRDVVDETSVRARLDSHTSERHCDVGLAISDAVAEANERVDAPRDTQSTDRARDVQRPIGKLPPELYAGFTEKCAKGLDRGWPRPKRHPLLTAIGAIIARSSIPDAMRTDCERSTGFR